MDRARHRPDVNADALGMRTFQLRKARATERAMERLRQGMKADWALLSNAEIEALSWVFGELWAYVARAEWDELHFSKLKYADVRSILNYAREIANHTRDSVDVLNDTYKVVAAKG